MPDFVDACDTVDACDVVDACDIVDANDLVDACDIVDARDLVDHVTVYLLSKRIQTNTVEQGDMQQVSHNSTGWHGWPYLLGVFDQI